MEEERLVRSIGGRRSGAPGAPGMSRLDHILVAYPFSA